MLLLLVSVVLVRSFSQATQIFELQYENDRLKQLVALQRELTQGRLEPKDIAVKLAESGDVERAAFFAAETLLQTQDITADDHQALLDIVQRYAERFPAQVGVRESTAELVARVIADGESRHSAVLSENEVAPLAPALRGEGSGVRARIPSDPIRGPAESGERS